jgi:hypothetical protein
LTNLFRSRIVGLKYKRASELTGNPYNWRTHPQEQRDAVQASLRELGWIAPVIENVRTGYLVDGHERVWQAMQHDEEVPVLEVDLSEEDERLALTIFDPLTGMANTDNAALALLLGSVQTSEESLKQLLTSMAQELTLLGITDKPLGVSSDAKPNPRKLDIDAIYTLQGPDATCCMAALAGLQYGTQSPVSSVCPNHEKLGGRHKVTFIDNDYFNYNHAAHVDACALYKPKYATTRDVMTRAQCKEAGIQYFELAQILDWAEEVAQYAENVIVIPKYDCIDEIPDKFMLGYSVPTSHGGTPLAVEAFKGRRTHLLGGSWKAQLAHLAELGEDVVSLDNNMVALIARWGQYVDGDGETHTLSDGMGIGKINNPRYVALALSFGAIGQKLHELYGSERTAAQWEDDEHDSQDS